MTQKFKAMYEVTCTLEFLEGLEVIGQMPSNDYKYMNITTFLIFPVVHCEQTRWQLQHELPTE